MSITKEQVFETAMQIEANGEKVTTRSVVAKIGGSHSTISDFLKEWKEKKAFAESLESEEISDAAQEKVRLFVAEIFREARTTAQVDNVALREQIVRYQLEIQQIEEDNDKYVDELVEKHAKEIVGKIEEFESLMSNHELEVDALREELENEKTLNEASERALKDAEMQIQRLQKEVARLEEKASSGADFEAIKTLIENTMKTNK